MKIRRRNQIFTLLSVSGLSSSIVQSFKECVTSSVTSCVYTLVLLFSLGHKASTFPYLSTNLENI